MLIYVKAAVIITTWRNLFWVSRHRRSFSNPDLFPAIPFHPAGCLLPAPNRAVAKLGAQSQRDGVGDLCLWIYDLRSANRGGEAICVRSSDLLLIDDIC